MTAASPDALSLRGFADSRLIPIYACGISISVLILHALAYMLVKKRVSRTMPPLRKDQVMLDERDARVAVSTFSAQVESHGGLRIYAFHVLSLLGCIGLVVLSLIAVVLNRRAHASGDTENPGVLREGWPQITLTVAYSYAAILSLATLRIQDEARQICNLHTNAVLLALFVAFAWRNLLPLTAVSGVPADFSVPWLLWSRGVLVSLVGVIIPLLTPRIYQPVDPSNPAESPNPAQTASVLSFILFTFVEPFVIASYRAPNFRYELLPPLADYDWAENLAARSLHRLEPLTRRKKGLRDRHLFFGLMEVFAWDYVRMSIFMTLYAFAGFLGPMGINRLLEYLETGGQGATVRPWVWISFLFLDPVLVAICGNQYTYLVTRILVQAENVLMQLLFQHALKARISGAAPLVEQSVHREDQLDALDFDCNPIPEDARAGVADSDDGTVRDSENLESLSSGAQDTVQTVYPEEQNRENVHASRSEGSHLAGRLTNLLGTDLGNVIEGRDFLLLFLQIPLQIFLCVWFLYGVLGWAAIVGTGVMIMSLPLPGLVAKLFDRAQKEQMLKTDMRVEAITDALSMIRMIKMFGWETRVKSDLQSRREAELHLVAKKKILGLLHKLLAFVLPLVTMVVTFAFYTVVLKKTLNASRVFSAMAVFDTLQAALTSSFLYATNVIQAKVSLDRISEFVNNSDLVDDSVQDLTTPHIGMADYETDDAFFGSVAKIWCFGRTPSTLLPTGSGKTSMLMALLGEMHFQPSSPTSWFRLPRSQGVAYAAQESWLQSGTIKANILFGASYDKARYYKVLYQCALEPDLLLFRSGDDTEIGDRTLSGGQKARITLARAIYSLARIVLLDDVFSALDVHTSRWIVEKCLQGDLVKGRTIILVTHNVALLAPVAGNIVSLDGEGRISSQGTVAQALSVDVLLRAELQESAKAVAIAEEVEDLEGQPGVSVSEGKLVLAEEMAKGRLGWPTLDLLLSSLGGVPFWCMILGGYLLAEVTSVVGPWWLGVWATAYERAAPDAVDVPFYLTVYGAIMIVYILLYASNFTVYTFASVKASRKLYDMLCNSVLGSTLRWFDSTPVGRILSRFTQDIRELDGPVTAQLQELISRTLALLMNFSAVVLISPVFAFPGVAIAVVGGFLGHIYISAQMPVKRESSNSRSPLFSHFSAAINGLVSIRAYGAEQAFQSELHKRLDDYARPTRTFWNLNRWIAIRAEMLAGLFAASLGAYLVYFREGVGASNTGFSLNMAVGFSSRILWWVRLLNAFEVSANSVERIRDYLVIDQEDAATEAGKPPAYWPASGAIKVENLSARYSKDGPVVLDNISFEIKSGERVGIVGRTGSGKSSLTLALLRMIPSTGVVYFDGLPTHKINVDALRTSLTIIPQDPALISGTLRSNLDPFAQHEDSVLNGALRAAGLYRLQKNGAGEGGITLDFPVMSGGTNFSVGQRQIIALARAIVRGAKVLILDEATASVDAETDEAIQASIRSELQHATLITIAHRLHTIADYDKIMVLDAGKLVECDSPLALLERKDSFFHALVEQSGDREKLWEVARKGRGDGC